MWQDGHQRKLSSNTTAILTPDQLFKVTSEIRVSSSDKNNYTCIFANDVCSATFHIPDEIPVPRVKNDALIIVLSIGVIMVVIIVVMLMYRQQKGSRTKSTRNLLVNSQRSVPAAACCMEEHLGAFLKAHYSDSSLSTEVRRHCDAFCVEELPHKLQNNKDQPVNLQALLPEAGETLFLEGPSGSGKTTVAHILVSSWTEMHTHALSNLLDLSTLRLLLYVDCSKVKDGLFPEILIQLSLTEQISGDELRAILTRSSEALLLLDGYREGKHFFDKSLRKFLMEKRGCRVLVMACPGHCPTLKDTVGTEGVLQLQTQSMT
ncbi:hypothetical protein FQN60_008011 [Etheostoma spectabile]|uniref:NACHT domain-containing protein n=1 Tax=Etheostoma spectabile TaxID=54343 RepID=A0A5J5CU66_9PERO|nr:hypothetical protein FQN60_008011 [Etheostoma spectabile]